ncbi:conserved hypothetical protein [Tenacibaculum sp. 190524A02b]|uniref:Uncharacterized protein n=1 Tax=Tenacibaculum vairaonense TaxID=3137860 RepID=A0ABP1F924_9FLAO
MNVILSHPQDHDAIWLYLALQKQNIPIELISPEELLMAKEWKQIINEDENSFYIKTKKGVEISNKNLNFLFNRTQIPKSPIWEKAAEAEKQYVHAEMNALLMSWLYQVQESCPIYNPSIGYSLSGVFWSPEQWAKAAYVAGFKNVNSNNTHTPIGKNILVIGKKVITNCINKQLVNNCIELSNLAQTPLLEITVSNDEKNFIKANTFPSLINYGDKLVAIIKHIIHEN